MKARLILGTAMLGFVICQSNLPAQSEGGNSGANGGGSGVSGAGSSAPGGAADHGTGGKDSKGEGGSPVTPVPPETNTPEFHPPPTSASN